MTLQKLTLSFEPLISIWSFQLNVIEFCFLPIYCQNVFGLVVAAAEAVAVVVS